MVAERKYDDEEVGRLLRAAAELQSGREHAGDAEGTTLGELQRMAAEVGIAPENVELAARELDITPKHRSFDRPDSVFVEQGIDAELSDDAWDEIVAELRRFSGRTGKVKINDGVSEWSGGPDLFSTSLSMTRRRGRTRLRLLGDSGGIAATVGTLAFAFLTIAIPLVYAATRALLNPFQITLLCLVVIGLDVATSVGLVRTQRRQFRSRVEALSEKLAAIAAEESTPAPIEAAVYVEKDSTPITIVS